MLRLLQTATVRNLIDLSKIEYNQDPGLFNAQTSMNHATMHQKETYTNQFVDFKNSQMNKQDLSHNVKEVSKTSKSDLEYLKLLNEIILKAETRDKKLKQFPK